jgi:uncharacterized membrane protein YoaK (UPF0700 family)
MFAREGKARSFSENRRLAIALSAVAGAVNATGFFVVGSYTSHVTGNVARIGDELAQGHFTLAREALLLVVAFLVGAMVATVLVEGSRRLAGRAHYKSALLVETGVLGAFTLFSAGGLPTLTLTAMLCFAMGLQNALVTKISGAVVRTTHLTGVTTDFGIELVQVWLWFRERSRGMGLLGKLHEARRSLGDPELEQAWLHFTIFASFIVGATVGPLLYLQIGTLAMALPCAILILFVGRVAQTARRRSEVAGIVR